MESEKNQLYDLVRQNEDNAKQATAAVADQLARERDDLKLRMDEMEIEKERLAVGLVNTEAAGKNLSLYIYIYIQTPLISLSKHTAKQHAADMTAQLAAEREALQASLNRMEKEKLDLAYHLKSTEITAKEQADALTIQIEKEKLILQTELERMEIEKSDLAKRLASNEVEIIKAHTEKEMLKSLVHENEIKSKEANSAAAEQLMRERDELQMKMAYMEQQKNEQLIKEHDILIEQVKAMAREKDELDLKLRQQV